MNDNFNFLVYSYFPLFPIEIIKYCKRNIIFIEYLQKDVYDGNYFGFMNDRAITSKAKQIKKIHEAFVKKKKKTTNRGYIVLRFSMASKLMLKCNYIDNIFYT